MQGCRLTAETISVSRGCKPCREHTLLFQGAAKRRAADLRKMAKPSLAMTGCVRGPGTWAYAPVFVHRDRCQMGLHGFNVGRTRPGADWALRDVNGASAISAMMKVFLMKTRKGTMESDSSSMICA